MTLYTNSLKHDPGVGVGGGGRGLSQEQRLERSSPLKPVVRIQNNLVDIVTGWPSTKIAKTNSIRQKIWPPEIHIFVSLTENVFYLPSYEWNKFGLGDKLILCQICIFPSNVHVVWNHLWNLRFCGTNMCFQKYQCAFVVGFCMQAIFHHFTLILAHVSFHYFCTFPVCFKF